MFAPMINGDAIKNARDAASLRQEDLARTLGVTEVTIWRWESGRTKRLDFDMASRLAVALGVSVDDLHSPDADTPEAACVENGARS
jgi:transcriptional regulator with XRE-family HTH domain